MQSCSLQHHTLLPLVTSTTGCCFHFGSASSFFMDLFLHSFPVAYWAPTDLRGPFFSVISLPFHTVHEVLKARILKWFAIPFTSGPRFVRTFHHDLISWASLIAQLVKNPPAMPETVVWSLGGKIPRRRERLSHQGSPRILEWLAYPFSRRLSQPRGWTRVSCIAGRFFTNWAIREARSYLYLIEFCMTLLLALETPLVFHIVQTSIRGSSGDGVPTLGDHRLQPALS